MAELQKVAVTKGGNSKSLHTMMMNLLEDNEVETRRITAGQFKGASFFCSNLISLLLIDTWV